MHLLPGVNSRSQSKTKDELDAIKFQKFVRQQLEQMPNLPTTNPKQIINHLTIKYMKMQNHEELAQSALVKSTEKKYTECRQILHLPQILHCAYTYYLGTGNNHKIINKVLAARVEWAQIASQNDQNVNFRWQQTNFGFNYDRLSTAVKSRIMVNHFEFHSEISQKHNLLRNFKSFCESNNLDPWDYIPITFELDFTNDRGDNLLQNFLLYYDTHAPDAMKLKQDQQRKFYMIRKLLSTYQHQSESPKLLQKAFTPLFSGSEYLWILKPTQLNRGRGIHVIKNLDVFVQLVDSYLSGRQVNEGQPIRAKQFVIQKYMERPLLINQRKFDIRIWCLLNMELELFIFEQGYLRLASEEYNPKNTTNQYIHLTNNAIQKQNPKYGQFESGNQLSFEQAQIYFASKGDFRKSVVERMKQISFMAFSSVRKKINLLFRKNCFEIFGLDFMVDESFRPWLIEVNTNPCLEESSPLLQMLIPRMLDDAFILTLDTVFPTERKKRFPVQHHPDHFNMWVKIGKLSDRVEKN